MEDDDLDLLLAVLFGLVAIVLWIALVWELIPAR